jgi:Family of unknown function (DUF6003)
MRDKGGSAVAETAFVVIVPAGRTTDLGVSAEHVAELGFWQTSAVHGWLQAFHAEEGATVRVVPADDAELIPEDAERLEVPLSPDEDLRVTLASASPDRARAVTELLSFRRAVMERPAIVERAHAAGLSTARIEHIGGRALTEGA